MAKILVTGSRGTLGRPLVKQLTANGHEVWEADIMHHDAGKYIRADISSYRQLEKVFEQDYDFVYHLAAEFGRHNGEEFYDTLWQTNVIGTRNILQWQLKKAFKLIFASSSEIYGNTNAQWLSEDLPMQQSILPHNDYALSKWVSEIQIMNFEQLYCSPIMRLRFFNAYGPGEYYHPYRSVVCVFIYRALHSLPYTVYLGYHRVFMYIDDFINTLANAVSNFHPGEVYNIGGREYRSVQQLSDLVLQFCDANPNLVQYEKIDTHNTVNKRPDISKAERELGHNPQTTLEEGLLRTITWMKKVYGK